MYAYKTKKSSNNLRLITVLVCAMIVTLFFVWTRLQNIRIRREIARLNAQEVKANYENNQLKLKLAQLTSPHRLETIGMQRYKLKRPSPNQVIILRDP